MLIGLTGIFGSGKSTVLEMFKDMGAVILSADDIVHQLLKEPDVKAEIRRVLGADVFIGAEVDRKSLARRIFSSERDRERLEEILHPLVYREVNRLYQNSQDKIVVAEVPLLFESGRQGDFDVVILVFCEAEKAAQRLKERGFSEEEVRQRLSAQMPMEKKAGLADFIIDNSGPVEETRRQVQDLWKRLISKTKGSSE